MAAVLTAQAGDASYAAELIGLTQAAPKELTGWLEKWQMFQEICHQIEAQLGAEVYTTLLESGSKLDLDDVVQKLLEAEL